MLNYGERPTIEGGFASTLRSVADARTCTKVVRDVLCAYAVTNLKILHYNKVFIKAA